jgi:hypothetical protein
MQQIPLSQNQVAIVDDEDFDRLKDFRWFYRGERGGKQGYAIRHEKEGRRYKTQYLHREVVVPVPPGHKVIFRNRDKLDCRKENLRVTTAAEAQQYHKPAHIDSESVIGGISYNDGPNTRNVGVRSDC